MLLGETETLQFVKIDSGLRRGHIIARGARCWCCRPVDCAVENLPLLTRLDGDNVLQRPKLPTEIRCDLGVEADREDGPGFRGRSRRRALCGSAQTGRLTKEAIERDRGKG